MDQKRRRMKQKKKSSDLSWWTLIQFILLVLLLTGEMQPVFFVLTTFVEWAMFFITKDLYQTEDEAPLIEKVDFEHGHTIDEMPEKVKFAISTMLDYYLESEVVQWCIKQYKWDQPYATKVVEKMKEHHEKMKIAHMLH